MPSYEGLRIFQYILYTDVKGTARGSRPYRPYTDLRKLRGTRRVLERYLQQSYRLQEVQVPYGGGPVHTELLLDTEKRRLVALEEDNGLSSFGGGYMYVHQNSHFRQVRNNQGWGLRFWKRVQMLSSDQARLGKLYMDHPSAGAATAGWRKQWAFHQTLNESAKAGPGKPM